MGSENSAPYLMAYAAPYAGLGLNSPNFFLFSPVFTYASTSGYLNRSSDANKVTYFTPRFGGFQLGVSYTPNVDAVGGNRQTFGLNTDEDPGDHNHVFGAGANFVESFNSLDIAIFAGAEWANLEANTGGDYYDDFESYQGGLNIGFAGFTLGGSVSYNNGGTGGDFDTDVWFYDAGLTYASGPWTVGVTYSHSDYELDSSIVDAEEDRDMVELGVNYKLAPGVTLVGALQWMDEDSNLSGDLGGDLPVDFRFDTEGFAGAVGTKLTF